MAQKSVFCHLTLDFVNGWFVALSETVDLAPSDRFFVSELLPFSFACGLEKCIWVKGTLHFPRLQKIKSRELEALQLLASYWSWGESILSREYAAGSRLFWKVSSFSVGRCEQLFSPQAIGLHQAPSRFSSWFETELKKIKQAHNKTWVNSDHWPDLWQNDEAV